MVASGNGWARLLCTAFGHRWRIREINVQRALLLADERAAAWLDTGDGYLFARPLDGALATCERCSAIWDDRGSAEDRERAAAQRLIVRPGHLIVRVTL